MTSWSSIHAMTLTDPPVLGRQPDIAGDELEQLKLEARQVKKYCDLDGLMSDYRAELA